MPPLDTIQLAHPLRDARVLRFGDAESLRQQDLQTSYERGRQEGERRLGEQLVQQRAELMEVQTGVLAAIRNAVPQVARDAERALVSLALEAARKLVAGLPITPEMIEGAIREACAAVADTTDVTVLLHAEDLAVLERMNSPILLPQGGHEQIRFVASSQVSRGGCIVQTRFGVLDARRETKSDLLERTLLP